jgi:hypothetical protein
MPEGDAEGDAYKWDGLALGDSDGEAEGDADGDAEGVAEGEPDGEAEGVALGEEGMTNTANVRICMVEAPLLRLTFSLKYE